MEGIKRCIWIPTEFNDAGTPIIPIRNLDKKIRICGDYSTSINDFYEDLRFTISSDEELMRQLDGNHFFTKIDLAGAYHQIALAPETQMRVAISTYKGVLLQCRLPMGIKSDPGYFQEIMTKMICNLEGVVIYLDTMLFTGRDEVSHLRNLEELLQRLQDKGLRYNYRKYQFAQSEVVYLGHTISNHEFLKVRNRKQYLRCQCRQMLTRCGLFWDRYNFTTNFFQTFHLFVHHYDLNKK